MADINELLQQAAEEAERVSHEVALSHQVVVRLSQLAVTLGDAVDAGAADSQTVLDTLATRLGEAEEEVARETGTAVATLRTLQSAAGALRGESAQFLANVHQRLEELAEERDRTLAEAEEGSTTAGAALTRYTAHVQVLEAAADARLLEARRHLEALNDQANDVRRRVSDAGDSVLARIHGLAENVRHEAQELMETYDALSVALGEQVSTLQTTLKGETDNTTVELTRRLSREVPDTLGDAVKPLRKTLDELDKWGNRGRGRSDERMGEIAGRLEALMRLLDGMKMPLESARQQLH